MSAPATPRHSRTHRGTTRRHRGTLSRIARWCPGLTIRSRLTVSFVALVATAGIAMVIIVYVFMLVVPTYGVSRGPANEALETVLPLEQPAETAYTVAPFTLDSPIDILNTTVAVSAAVLAILIAAGVALAWYLSGRILRPLQAINEAAQLASTGSFDHRVGLDGPQDELRDLSNTFDHMLTRLDVAFQAHQRFAANASHELRTPIAATHTMLEVALADPDISHRELRQVAERVFETNRRNGQLVDALLELAELGQRQLCTGAIDMPAMINDTLAQYDTAVRERCIHVRATLGKARAFGDEVLLRHAVTNLVSNAVRHNLIGGFLEIETSRVDDSVLIRVENSGTELSASRVAQLTEPFARGAGRTAPTSGGSGHGLGLALVSTIADAHRAHLILQPRPGGGLVATLELRAAPLPTNAPKDPALAMRR